MKRRERREDRDHPEPQPREEREGRPEARAPGAATDDVRPRDGLREQDEAEKQEPAGEQPVGDLSARHRTSSDLVALHVLHEPGGDEQREGEADGDDEERRLNGPVPQALALWVEERHAVGLGERPHDPGEDRQRPDRLEREHARAAARLAPLVGSCAGGDELVHDGEAVASRPVCTGRPAARNRERTVGNRSWRGRAGSMIMCRCARPSPPSPSPSRSPARSRSSLSPRGRRRACPPTPTATRAGRS